MIKLLKSMVKRLKRVKSTKPYGKVGCRIKIG